MVKRLIKQIGLAYRITMSVDLDMWVERIKKNVSMQRVNNSNFPAMPMAYKANFQHKHPCHI